MFMKKLCLQLVIFLIIITGCSPLQHKSGEKFHTQIWTEGRNPTYIYGGQLSGVKFYYLNSYWYLSDTIEYGVLVDGDRIVKSLNKDEAEQIKVQIIAQDIKEQKIALKTEQDKRDKIISQDRLTRKQNTQENSNKKITLTEALAIQVAPIYQQTAIFEAQKRQWDNNVRFGAAPISSTYIRMIN